jgi:hypothetical protein
MNLVPFWSISADEVKRYSLSSKVQLSSFLFIRYAARNVLFLTPSEINRLFFQHERNPLSVWIVLTKPRTHAEYVCRMTPTDFYTWTKIPTKSNGLKICDATTCSSALCPWRWTRWFSGGLHTLQTGAFCCRCRTGLHRRRTC